MTAAARAALGRIPGFAGLAAEARIEPLAGLSNRAFRVTVPSGDFALRLAGDTPRNRAAEATNARRAAAAGIGPEVIHAKPRAGVMLCRWIAGARPFDAALAADPAALGRAAGLLRRLNRSGLDFVGRLDPAAAILAEHERCSHQGIPPPCSETAARAVAERLRSVWADEAAPCHGDACAANLLDDGARAWLIDYEYSGGGDPLWDLAYLAADTGLDDARALLAAYGETAPTADLIARFEGQRAAAALLIALWMATRVAPRSGRR